MNKSQKKRTSLFYNQGINSDDFWVKKKSNIPPRIDFEGETHIKTSKSLLSEFSTKWLTFSSPILYLSRKRKSKSYQCLNLDLIPCKLYEYVIEKTKYPFKLVLRHDSKSAEFYFQERQAMDLWVSQLRRICIMCDLTSMYVMGNLMSKTNLFKTFWAQSKLNGHSYMAKVYNLQDDANIEEDLQAKIEKQVIINEIKALRTIDHPNVIKLKEVHEFQGRVVMILEFISGSSLLNHILSQGCLPEVETVYIMKTLLQVLKSLQEKQILHRNLKPENILFDYTTSGVQLKLTSFGFSCTLDTDEQTTWYIGRNICTKCGTPGYMAPELLNNKESTLTGDIFSMGVIMYTCLTGEPMFKGQTADDIVSKNLTISFDKTSCKWLSLSENARDLILKMIHEDPYKRPRVDTILKHPFFDLNQQSKPLRPVQFKQTPQYLGDNLAIAPRRSSIEELLQNEPNSKFSVDKALQSLIVSPTYFDFTKSDVPEVPEFYFDIENYETGMTQKIPKLELKIEIIKGSMAQLDSGESTPGFKIKSPRTNGVNMMIDDGDDYLSDEYDESSPTRNFKKMNTFPTAPCLVTQKPFVQKFNTMSYKLETEGSSDALVTERKLPELQGSVRTKVGIKSSILKDLSQEDKLPG